MKVIYPLGSLSASGHFARRLIYQNRRGKNLVYFKNPTKFSRTPAQRVTRHDYSVCVAEWRITRDAEWQKWVDLANPRHLTGLNLFMQWWITDLYNSRSGVGFCGGTIANAIRTTPKLSPYYMENLRVVVYGK